MNQIKNFKLNHKQLFNKYKAAEHKHIEIRDNNTKQLQSFVLIFLNKKPTGNEKGHANDLRPSYNSQTFVFYIACLTQGDLHN